MGKPLPEPLESKALKEIRKTDPLVKRWISHHLNNSLFPLSALIEKLKKGAPIEPAYLSTVEEAFWHSIQDLRTLTQHESIAEKNVDG